MDSLETTNVTHMQSNQLPSMTRKIGKTTYDVFVHFSETSKETLTDKVMRLIQNDVSTNNTF